MDSSADGRLQKLQMADLGTARREYISTRDAKRYVASRLEDIEASRMSNVAGSEAQRLAQNNKERLNEWSTMYKDVGDADSLEQLDELMHGQSHRANLSAKVQGSGGQTYSKSTKKDDNFLKLQRSSALRAVQSSGRGGGVVGTRARVPQPLPSRTPNQGSKVGHHVTPHHKTRLLDPALDPDEDFHKKNQKSGQLQGASGRGNTKAPQQPPRTKRVPSAANYARVLSNPNDFLAQARSLVKTRAPSNASAQSTEAPPSTPPGISKQGSEPTTEPRPKASKPAPTPAPTSCTTSHAKSGPLIPHVGARAPDPSVVNAKGNHIASKDITKQSPKAPKAVPNPDGSTGAKSEPLASRVSTPVRAPSTVNSQKSNCNSEGLSSSQHASPLSRPVGMSAKQSPRNSQQSVAQKRTPEKDENPQAGTDSAEDVLIDVSTTPSTDEALALSMEKMSLMSPGLKELKGLDFTQGSKDISPQQCPTAPPGISHSGRVNENSQEQGATRPPPGLVHPGNVNFEEAMDEYEKMEKGSANMDLETPPEPRNPEVDNCRREISELNDYMEAKSLSSGTVELLKATVRQLERKIEESLQKSSGIPSQSGGIGGQNVGNFPSTPLKAASNVPIPTKREAQLKTSYEASPPPQTFIKGGLIQPSPQRKESPKTTSPSPLRAAVTAAPFVPGRRTSFTQYRSPQNSISSESTTSHLLPSVPADHVYGDHLLPSAPDVHIFGDHLLPGQHTVPSSVSKFDTSPSKSSYHSDDPVSNWSYHTAPQSSNLSNTTITIPTVKDVSSGMSSANSEALKQASASPAARANTPETLKTPTQASFKGLPSPRANVTSQNDQKSSALQQSMHAPLAPQGPATSTSSKHAPARTASNDLQRSRYAPENYKPCR